MSKLQQKVMAIFCCRDCLNLAVLTLHESGELPKLHKKWWYDKGECAGEADGGVGCMCETTNKMHIA